MVNNSLPCDLFFSWNAILFHPNLNYLNEFNSANQSDGNDDGY